MRHLGRSSDCCRKLPSGSHHSSLQPKRGYGHRAAASGVRSLPRAVRQASRGQPPQDTGHRHSTGGKRMTTQDYHGVTNPSLAQGDPDMAADPGWQRQADDFAADRGERTSTYRIVPQTDSSDSAVASSEGVDEAP